MSEYYDVFCKNIERVEWLNTLYSKLRGDEENRHYKNKLTDILRSEVVLLHSSFEEYFRNILIQWLPIKADSKVLHDIPIGTKVGKKNEKICLDDLMNYRGKQIDDVIEESVKAHLELKSFNSQGDIRAWCDKIQINLDAFSEMKEVDKAIDRRHKIVHEADMEQKDSGKSRLSSIKPDDISPWIDAYKKLANIIENQIKCWEKELWAN